MIRHLALLLLALGALSCIDDALAGRPRDRRTGVVVATGPAPDSGVHPDAEVPDTGPPPDAGHPPSDYLLTLDGVDEYAATAQDLTAAAPTQYTMIVCGTFPSDSLVGSRLNSGGLGNWLYYAAAGTKWAEAGFDSLHQDATLALGAEQCWACVAANGVGVSSYVSESGGPWSLDSQALNAGLSMAFSVQNLALGRLLNDDDTVRSSKGPVSLSLAVAAEDALTIAELEELGRGGALLDLHSPAAQLSWGAALRGYWSVHPAYGSSHILVQDLSGNDYDLTVVAAESGDLAVVP